MFCGWSLSFCLLSFVRVVVLEASVVADFDSQVVAIAEYLDGVVRGDHFPGGVRVLVGQVTFERSVLSFRLYESEAAFVFFGRGWEVALGGGASAVREGHYKLFRQVFSEVLSDVVFRADGSNVNDVGVGELYPPASELGLVDPGTASDQMKVRVTRFMYFENSCVFNRASFLANGANQFWDLPASFVPYGFRVASLRAAAR